MEENNTMLDLFESFWFERMIFHQQPRTRKSSVKDSKEESNMKSSETSNQSLTTISSTESSISAELDSSGDSPSSVLLSGKLQTIFSGKEISGGEKYPPSTEREEVEEEEEETPKTAIMAEEQKHIRRNREMMMRMKRRGLSKSLSDLEFEEIKGFTDLGFVFSEEDRNSSFLASILPGLQRLGGGGEEEEEEEDDDDEEKRDEEQLQQLEPPREDEERKGGMRRRGRSRSSSADRRRKRGFSRPYLSEAWEVSYHPLMLKWEKIPSVKNEIDMKDYLKCWAHSVAESVR